MGNHLLAGAAVAYTRSSGRLDRSGGDLDVDSEHLGGFASLVWPTRFLDVAVSYSHHDLYADRAGVIGPIDGAPQGDAIGVGAQGGWLFGRAPFQIGPLATLQYDRTHIGDYTESGDAILTEHVEPQVEQTLTVGAGVQARANLRSHLRSLEYRCADAAVRRHHRGGRRRGRHLSRQTIEDAVSHERYI